MTASSNSMPMAPSAPIGIFDSGIGGLSVLRHIHQNLPHENLLYFADSAYAPYGDKSEAAISARTLAVTEFLLQSGAKALVVACNTATTAAIKAVRAAYPALPVIGIEPGLKPAAAQTRSKIVGVLATKATVSSARLLALQEQIVAASGVRFILQPCVGLVDQIEKGELRSPQTALLVRRYVAPLLEQGADTLVLGCTHYPFIRPLIENVVQELGSGPVAIIDTGDAVCRQLARVLDENGLLQTQAGPGSVAAFATGSPSMIKTTFASLLQLHPPVSQVATIALPEGIS
ncbi:glutamate racemase [Collimonas sp. PA-H2]|uniref:glutamate racemase n=1 Tax=Collimonas sp. PA-H2 TaxID=1881062 RepID=UPI000C013342|nr:glutamate racemase [Collimonas sp. PA-H2]PFH08546.1 glutamate racemase [Collimonas sp. PA-H2]